MRDSKQPSPSWAGEGTGKPYGTAEAEGHSWLPTGLAAERTWRTHRVERVEGEQRDIGHLARSASGAASQLFQRRG